MTEQGPRTPAPIPFVTVERDDGEPRIFGGADGVGRAAGHLAGELDPGLLRGRLAEFVASVGAALAGIPPLGGEFDLDSVAVQAALTVDGSIGVAVIRGDVSVGANVTLTFVRRRGDAGWDAR